MKVEIMEVCSKTYGGRALLSVENVTNVLDGYGGTVVFETNIENIMYTPCPEQYVIITK